ncbi:hypothetical protein NECAME_18170 [Necator americanus]|uniref:SCP domain-containing protein n=1 Tax=Necator americanus TaxID=51031 RepID=W2TCX3_NECAM|nr:hypothetical protein NECAME_18170 [Necator americanus]ETN78847.1 hypothetical protein NECAME_18170 [Necator americanus]
MWAATWCCIVFLAIVNDAVEAAESFGCRNSLISDEWREMVLTFHNKKRRTVSVGDQVSKNNQKLPAAKKMNKLTWDCNLEREATDGAAKCASYTKAGHGINEKVFAAGNTCNIETKTREVLNEWWDEITTRELVGSEVSR